MRRTRRCVEFHQGERDVQRLDARSGVQGTRGQTVNGQPLRLRWSKGCLWIDLDERIRRETFPSEGDKVPAAGGAWTILLSGKVEGGFLK